MTTKKEIILIGGGGHCKSVIDVIEAEEKYHIAGIIDKPEKLGLNILGYQIVGNDDDIEVIAKKCRNFLITIGYIGDNTKRVDLYDRIKKLDVKQFISEVVAWSGVRGPGSYHCSTP